MLPRKHPARDKVPISGTGALRSPALAGRRLQHHRLLPPSRNGRSPSGETIGTGGSLRGQAGFIALASRGPLCWFNHICGWAGIAPTGRTAGAIGIGTTFLLLGYVQTLLLLRPSVAFEGWSPRLRHPAGTSKPFAPLSASDYEPVGTLIATQAMIFWLLFLCCALSAWLIGYGMGYLRGVREAITGDASASTTNPVDVDRD